jgi:hypothetical protein
MGLEGGKVKQPYSSFFYFFANLCMRCLILLGTRNYKLHVYMDTCIARGRERDLEMMELLSAYIRTGVRLCVLILMCLMRVGFVSF